MAVLNQRRMDVNVINQYVCTFVRPLQQFPRNLKHHWYDVNRFRKRTTIFVLNINVSFTSFTLKLKERFFYADFVKFLRDFPVFVEHWCGLKCDFLSIQCTRNVSRHVSGFMCISGRLHVQIMPNYMIPIQSKSVNAMFKIVQSIDVKLNLMIVYEI